MTNDFFFTLSYFFSPKKTIEIPCKMYTYNHDIPACQTISLEKINLSYQDYKEKCKQWMMFICGKNRKTTAKATVRPKAYKSDRCLWL
jgi:hypothetical protein